MVHSQVCQDALRRVDKAYQKFFDDVKSKKAGQSIKVGYPRLKRFDQYKSFTFPQVWMTVRDRKTGIGKRQEIVKLRPITAFDGGKVRFAKLFLPGLGALKIRMHRDLEWDNAKTVTVKRTSSGHWQVSISVESPLTPLLSQKGNRTGVDVGLIKEIAISDGSYTEHPKFLRQSEHNLKKKQQSLSKKQKGSVNYAKHKRVLAKAHEHVAKQREDFLHKLSLWLVVTYAHIAFEKLNIAAMVSNPHFAKAILDAGWGTLIRFVTYKSIKLRGNHTVRVNPAYTSQDCCQCGYRVPKALADRVHECPQCGLQLCRDTNAARVIEKRAEGQWAAQADKAGSHKVGTEHPELVPLHVEPTPVEMGASAAPAVAVSPVVEARKPRLKPHLSRG